MTGTALRPPTRRETLDAPQGGNRRIALHGLHGRYVSSQPVDAAPELTTSHRTNRMNHPDHGAGWSRGRMNHYEGVETCSLSAAP
ncbi:hypothetical protein GCM10010518_23960 [Kitasatospora cinereorecta]